MITLKNVSKTLGKHLVLDNINYTFENGMVYGLCGHNGSGKTMLLRAIAGLIVPDDGEIIIDGKKLHNDISFPPNAGIVIESMELLPKYNAFDNLEVGRLTDGRQGVALLDDGFQRGIVSGVFGLLGQLAQFLLGGRIIRPCVGECAEFLYLHGSSFL